MRVLTVMSGVILSATGAWCLAYYRSAFSSIAFALAIAMILSAVFLIAAYIISGKKRLPDTVLVEGMLSFLFGFVILNNEVPDTALAMFFGAWLAIAGSIRFTQSFAVSRIDAHNWAKILPIAILNTVGGLIMMMHSLASQVNPLSLVGGAMILNGLSQLMYSLYMVKPEPLPQVAQAKARVEAKQAQAEARRKERDELRRLSRKEREAALRDIRLAAEEEAEKKKRLSRLEKERQRAARAALLDPTVQLSEEEMAIIADADPDAIGTHVPEEPAAEQAAEPAEKKPVVEEKADILDILEREVKAPELLTMKPLATSDLLETNAKHAQRLPEEAPRADEKPKRTTEEFSWTWPPQSD